MTRSEFDCTRCKRCVHVVMARTGRCIDCEERARRRGALLKGATR